MKGIRKLFFGLILMTLIGVGFRVDVNAANLELEWDTTNYVLTGYINFETPTDFPDQVKKYTYRYSLTPSVTGASGSFIFESRDDGAGGLAYYYNDSITDSSREELFSLTAEEVRSVIKSNSTVFNLKCTGAPAIEPGSVTINAGKVTAAAYGKNGKAGSKFTTNPISPTSVFLFDGETGSFDSMDSILESNITYKHIEWTADDPSAIDNENGFYCEYTMDNPATDVTLKQIFGSVYTSESEVSVQAGNTTKSIKYTKYGYDLADLETATVKLDNGTPITAAWDANTVKFDIAGVTDAGLYDVIVTMTDDTVYTFEDLLLVYGTGEVTLVPVIVTNGMTISLGCFSDDDYVLVEPNITSAASTYVSRVVPSGTRYLAAWKVKGLKETSSSGVPNGIKVGSTTTSVTVYPKPTASFGSSSSLSLSSTSNSSSSSEGSLTVTMPTEVYHDDILWGDGDVTGARLEIEAGGNTRTEDITGFTTSGMKQTKSFSRSSVSNIVADMLDDKDGDSYTVTIRAYPMNGSAVDTKLPATTTITAYKVTLDTSGGAKYTVNGSDKSGSFYVLDGTSITVKSSAERSGERFQSWDDSVFSSESGGTYKVLGAKRFKANYSNGSSSMNSSSTTGRNSGAAGEGMDDYDDVPKTGESKTDIWILWSVLFVSILGAGFMIWKRFGLVRAIAEADEEVAVAEHKEEVKAKKKEKEDKLKMLKDLRNL